MSALRAVADRPQPVDAPILFSAPMVRALLAGTKTQTRRVIKPQPKNVYQSDETGEWLEWWYEGKEPCGAPTREAERPLRMKYALGDRLWVREAWRTHRDHDQIAPQKLLDGSRSVLIAYGADGDAEEWLGRPRPSIHMPRWVSRLTLTVTDVRIQRLQDISRDDAIAEGLRLASSEIEEFFRWPTPFDSGMWLSPPAAYAWLWEQINGAGSWASNPWVVVISFRVVKKNIDAIPAPTVEEGS